MALIGLLTGAGAKGFLNSRDPELVKIEVMIKDLPPEFDHLTVGQLTDIHSSWLTPPSLIRAGVDLLVDAKPDLVALTGDFITGRTRLAWGGAGKFNQTHLDNALKEFARLAPPLGSYAVLGNHDFWSGPEAVEAIVKGLQSIGVSLLRNEWVSLKNGAASITLVGVDDYWSNTYSLARAFKGAPSGVRLLLSHNPDVNEEVPISNQRVDLIISGHTHGGQVVLPWIGAPFLPSAFGQRYREGLVRDGERQTYISRGLGVFFAPLRFNCPAEVTLITLVRG